MGEKRPTKTLISQFIEEYTLISSINKIMSLIQSSNGVHLQIAQVRGMLLMKEAINTKLKILRM